MAQFKKYIWESLGSLKFIGIINPKKKKCTSIEISFDKFVNTQRLPILSFLTEYSPILHLLQIKQAHENLHCKYREMPTILENFQVKFGC